MLVTCGVKRLQGLCVNAVWQLRLDVRCWCVKALLQPAPSQLCLLQVFLNLVQCRCVFCKRAEAKVVGLPAPLRCLRLHEGSKELAERSEGGRPPVVFTLASVVCGGIHCVVNTQRRVGFNKSEILLLHTYRSHGTSWSPT